MGESSRVIRFSLRERAVHWLVALVFLYLALTGLALWSPRLYWLAAVMGGGGTARAWHPWAGILFTAAFLLMFFSWQRVMRLDAGDRKWLQKSHRYAAHDFGAMPPPGRFNAGQKGLFWLQAFNAFVLLSTGCVLWFPGDAPRVLREVSIVVHPAAGMLAIGGLVLHIYMGTAATPGAFRGMTQGWVTRRWALSHHPRWRAGRD